VISLETPLLRLDVLPDLGGGVARLDLRHPSLGVLSPWRPAPATPTCFTSLASYSLVPWSNRIDHATLHHRGRTHRLKADWRDGTAIHGDAKHRPWRVLDRSPRSVRLAVDVEKAGDRNFPWAYRAVIRYELRGATLLTALSVTNLDREPFPVGLGFHPFWQRRLAARDGTCGGEAIVRLPVAARYPCERVMPAGPAVRDDVVERLAGGTTLEGLDLDDVFAGFEGRAEVTWPGAGVTARCECSPEFSHAVLYSPQTGPDAGCFCLEPVTMVNNGFNLREAGWPGTGVVDVDPGRTFEGAWSVSFDVEDPA
jgi:aldose 1-epimerase